MNGGGRLGTEEELGKGRTGKRGTGYEGLGKGGPENGRREGGWKLRKRD